MLTLLAIPELHSEIEKVSTTESKRTNFFGRGFLRGQSEHIAVGGIAALAWHLLHCHTNFMFKSLAAYVVHIYS
jgi:hypothetical protein